MNLQACETKCNCSAEQLGIQLTEIRDIVLALVEIAEGVSMTTLLAAAFALVLKLTHLYASRCDDRAEFSKGTEAAHNASYTFTALCTGFRAIVPFQL